jgi:hypothetical protein
MSGREDQTHIEKEHLAEKEEGLGWGKPLYDTPAIFMAAPNYGYNIAFPTVGYKATQEDNNVQEDNNGQQYLVDIADDEDEVDEQQGNDDEGNFVPDSEYEEDEESNAQ